MSATVYLIPTVLADGATHCLPPYLLDAIKSCQVFFAENERTARRYFKSLWKEMVIDAYEWHTIKDVDKETTSAFTRCLQAGKTTASLAKRAAPAWQTPGRTWYSWHSSTAQP
jgi:16S rRNA (cytidine1402-2'-O)-methyltransferase